MGGAPTVPLEGDAALETAPEPRARVRAVDAGEALGRYELVDELGQGGMATVFRARDTSLRREVAVKVLLPHLCKRRDIVARFQREARAAAALDHPGVVRVYDVGGGEAGAHGVEPPYLVMELIRGRSLQDFVDARPGPILAEIAAAAGVVMAGALAAAHRAGIVHRDVKPANILVADDGRLLLGDFGVARIEDDDASLVTRTGALIGTPAFMSPEQASGEALDARSDIYSLGATLYRLAAGVLPVTGSTARVVATLATGDIKPVVARCAAAGTELSRVIARMMAREPGDRYPGAAEAAEALAGLVTGAGLGEPEAEIAAFFADPDGYTAARTPGLVASLLGRARVLAEQGAATQAMALADRVVALAPDSPAADQAMALVRGLGHGRRRRVVGIAAASALTLALVTAGVLAAWSRTADAPDTAAALSGPADAGAPADAAARALSGPADAAAALAVVPADAAPGVRPRRVGSRPRPGPTPAGPAAADIDAGLARPVPAAEPDAGPPAPGAITLDIRPWCDVRIDGADHGRARRDRVISLAPGRHEIVCSQGPGRAEWRQTIHLTPGQRLDLTGSVLRPVRVRVAVKAGRVLIQGQAHDSGAELLLAPGRYRVDVVAGERRTGAWISVPAVDACTLRDVPALDCYP